MPGGIAGRDALEGDTMAKGMDWGQNILAGVGEAREVEVSGGEVRVLVVKKKQGL